MKLCKDTSNDTNDRMDTIKLGTHKQKSRKSITSLKSLTSRKSSTSSKHVDYTQLSMTSQDAAHQLLALRKNGILVGGKEELAGWRNYGKDLHKAVVGEEVYKDKEKRQFQVKCLFTLFKTICKPFYVWN